MRLTLYKLTQLAVSAKILCLLMVLSHFCGVAMEDVKLFHKNSFGYVRVNKNGKVEVGDKENYLRITTNSVGYGFKSGSILLYDIEMEMFICFDKKWKLVGKNIKIEKARMNNRCNFKEKLKDHGIVEYHSANRTNIFMRFNKRGKPCPKRTTSLCGLNAGYFYRSGKQTIDEHNLKVKNEYHGNDERNQPNRYRGPKRLQRHDMQDFQQQQLLQKHSKPKSRVRHRHDQRTWA